MKPKTKVFTRERPCSKLDIWNCFRGRRGFVRVRVVHAHSTIGLNAPRYLKRMKYVTRVNTATAEYLQLTEEGKEWLLLKFEQYLKNHPTDRQHAANVPRGW